MKRTMTWLAVALLVVPAMLLSCTSSSALSARKSLERAQKGRPDASSGVTLTVLNPQGFVKKNKVLAPRLKTLGGKKIALWLSATPDQLYAGKGAELYDLLEKMLRDKYPDIRIVHYADLPMKYTPRNEVVDAIAATEPDAVVVGFGG